VIDDEVRGALMSWRIEPRAVRRTDAGTMNEVFVVDSDDGRLVLRGHRRQERDLVEFEHDVMERARDHGVPAPVSVPTPSGARVARHGGRWWSLLRWIEGTQPERGTHTTAHAEAMGAMLARIHDALGEMRSAARPEDPTAPTAEVVERIDWLILHIEALPDQGPDETAALIWLRGQQGWLRPRAHDAPPDAGHRQVIHGDFHDANVLFAGPEVAGVIDWDTAGLGEPAIEAIRAIHLSFRLAADPCRAFVAGYRSVLDLPDRELARAASSYGFRRDRSVWLFEDLYLHGNERLRPLINRRPFVPFETSWAEVAPLLARTR
jgi:Ser/Thr protein kinase RdoA (MazF antagonist)